MEINAFRQFAPPPPRAPPHRYCLITSIAVILYLISNYATISMVA